MNPPAYGAWNADRGEHGTGETLSGRAKTATREGVGAGIVPMVAFGQQNRRRGKACSRIMRGKERRW
jgi:predicted NUDIX family NTP pyrophosphohydrolase